MRTNKIIGIVFILWMCGLCAGEGDLDPSFGTAQGFMTMDIDGGTDVLYSCTVQPDGKLVAVGAAGSNILVMRLNQQGFPDTSFGNFGRVSQFLAGAHISSARGVVVQSDGKIVVVGRSGLAGMFIARFTAQGALDTTYTYSKAGYSMHTRQDNTTPLGLVNDCALQSDGQVVVAGEAGANIFVARFGTNGEYDTNFNNVGTQGYNITAVTGGNDLCSSVTIQYDKEILVVGTEDSDNVPRVFVLRYHGGKANPDPENILSWDEGTLDTTFGSGGKIANVLGNGASSGYDLALDLASTFSLYVMGTTSGNASVACFGWQAGATNSAYGSGGVASSTMGGSSPVPRKISPRGDGKVVFAGTASGNVFIAQFAANGGALDTTFAPNVGFLFTNLGGTDAAWGMVQLKDRRVVSVGSSGDDVAIVRYEANGSLDLGFGIRDGFITPSNVTKLTGVALLGDKMVAVGGTSVYRFTRDGFLDSSFATGGIQDLSADFALSVSGVKIQPDGKIIVCGRSATDTAKVARLNSDGSYDSSFGTNGKSAFTKSSGECNLNVIHLFPDGKMLVGGYSNGGTELNLRSLFLVKLLANGNVDTTFNTQGLLSPGEINHLIGGNNEVLGIDVQEDGNILAVGTGDNGSPATVVSRYQSDGTSDFSLGTGNGYVYVANSQGQFSTIKALPGSDFLVGYRHTTGPAPKVNKYISIGTLDTSFGGGDGIADTQFSNDGQIHDLIVLPDQRIVCVGGNNGGPDAVIERLTANGIVDTSFSSDGVTAVDAGGDPEYFTRVIGRQDGKLLAVGMSGANQGLIARFQMFSFGGVSGGPAQHFEGRVDFEGQNNTIGGGAIVDRGFAFKRDAQGTRPSATFSSDYPVDGLMECGGGTLTLGTKMKCLGSMYTLGDISGGNNVMEFTSDVRKFPTSAKSDIESSSEIGIPSLFITTADWSPDSQFLVYAGNANSSNTGLHVDVYDGSTRTPSASENFTANSPSIRSVRCNPQTPRTFYAYSYSDDNTKKVATRAYNANTDISAWNFASTEVPYSIAWSNDGRFLACVTYDGSSSRLYVREVDSGGSFVGNQLFIGPFSTNQPTNEALGFSVFGDALSVGTRGGTCYLFEKDPFGLSFLKLAKTIDLSDTTLAVTTIAWHPFFPGLVFGVGKGVGAELTSTKYGVYVYEYRPDSPGKVVRRDFISTLAGINALHWVSFGDQMAVGLDQSTGSEVRLQPIDPGSGKAGENALLEKDIAGDVTVTQISPDGQYLFASASAVAGSGVIYNIEQGSASTATLTDVTLKFNSDVELTQPIILSGNCKIVNDRGKGFSLGSGGKITLADNATLTLQNVSLNGLQGGYDNPNLAFGSGSKMKAVHSHINLSGDLGMTEGNIAGVKKSVLHLNGNALNATGNATTTPVVDRLDVLT